MAPDLQENTSRNVWKYAFYLRKILNIAMLGFNKEWRQSYIGKRSPNRMYFKATFVQANIHILYRKEKKGDLTQSYDKTSYTNRKFETKGQHTNATKNFDYITIADRLRTVSWSNNSHPTGVVKPVYGYPTFPLPQKPCYQKDTHLKICNNPPYVDWGPTANQSGEVIKMWYTNMYSNKKYIKKYLVTSIKVGCATRSLYAGSGPKAEEGRGSGIRTLSPLWRFRQGPSYSPNRLVNQSATL